MHLYNGPPPQGRTVRFLRNNRYLYGMKITKKQAIGENLLYVMVWLAIILVPVLNSQMMSELHISLENVLIAWRKIAPYLIVFIVHNAIIAPRLMLRHRYALYLVVNLLFIIAVFWAVDLYDQYFSTPLLFTDEEPFDEHRKASFTDLELYWNVVLALFMTGANSGIKLMYQSIRDEQEMEELKRQNMQAEMDYLKYQINPHFFMNTLNNIHALVDIDPGRAQSSIILLSRMMRYVVYESESTSIPLQKEVEFLSNYITLMRLRFTSRVHLTVDMQPKMQGEVPPLLFIMFVENAFKHGVSYQRDTHIHILMEQVGERIHFFCENPKIDSLEDVQGGVGMRNVRKRLDLIYGDCYTLRIDDDPNRYTVDLTVPMEVSESRS